MLMTILYAQIQPVSATIKSSTQLVLGFPYYKIHFLSFMRCFEEMKDKKINNM